MKIDLTAIIIALIGLMAIGLVVKITLNKKKYKVTQKNIISGGDVAGRDIKR